MYPMFCDPQAVNSQAACVAHTDAAATQLQLAAPVASEAQTKVKSVVAERMAERSSPSSLRPGEALLQAHNKLESGIGMEAAAPPPGVASSSSAEASAFLSSVLPATGDAATEAPESARPTGGDGATATATATAVAPRSGSAASDALARQQSGAEGDAEGTAAEGAAEPKKRKRKRKRPSKRRASAAATAAAAAAGEEDGISPAPAAAAAKTSAAPAPAPAALAAAVVGPWVSAAISRR
eukprot:COSAG04_NODE_1403_length_6916_cov_3.059704_1_plen_238_part_10